MRVGPFFLIDNRGGHVYNWPRKRVPWVRRCLKCRRILWRQPKTNTSPGTDIGHLGYHHACYHQWQREWVVRTGAPKGHPCPVCLVVP